MKKQKIIIADNNKYFREGLKEILLNIGNVEIVAEVANAFSLLNALENRRVDVVFTELELPVVNGIEIIRMGHRKYPKTRFIAFSSLENKRYVDEIMAAGASAYLFKSNDNYDLLNTIIHRSQAGMEIHNGSIQEHNRLENTVIN